MSSESIERFKYVGDDAEMVAESDGHYVRYSDCERIVKELDSQWKEHETAMLASMAAQGRWIEQLLSAPSLSDAIKEVEKMRDENNRNYGYWKSVSSNPDTDLGVLKFAAWAGEDERVITALKSLGPQREDWRC